MKNFSIQNRKIGPGQPCYIIAEISCNHEGDIEEARAIIKAAADCGADAVKLQTYKPDTITRNFQTKPKGTIWENTDLFSLYQKAYTPWEWYGELKKCADVHGLHIFSSPFDETAVDFLETQNVPAYKVASFEIVDTKLLQKVAATGKPVIISNGMTDYLELKEAVDTLRNAGVKDLAVLHCNSGYPAAFEEANLNTIPAIEKLFDCVTGLSDHTLFAEPTTYKDALAHITAFEAVKKGAKNHRSAFDVRPHESARAYGEKRGRLRLAFLARAA
ncbi:MAG: N-acetylneuraminate synthase family protein [Alphaproteobacteria bacterium]|nr:N-acetylneuraminate synthase family protein [Alphaproteobacteria bacterium]